MTPPWDSSKRFLHLNHRLPNRSTHSSSICPKHHAIDFDLSSQHLSLPEFAEQDI